jgi:hypothetical protein
MPKTKLFKDNVLAAGKKSPEDIIKFEFELNDGITGDQIDQNCYKLWSMHKS